MNDMFDLSDVVLQRTAAETLPTNGKGPVKDVAD
jgi:hypothetical protein